MKLKAWLKDPKRRHGRFSLILLLLFLAAAAVGVALIDTLEVRGGWRADYSFNSLTTQSETTQAVLRELDKPVHIYALFKKGEEDLPLFEVLNRYSALSEQVTWEQVDVSLNPGLVAKFRGDSENTLSTNSLVVYCQATDRYKILSSFVSLSYDVDAGAYAFSGLTYEKELSEAIVYVTRESIPPVMLLQGHHELDANGAAFLMDYLARNNYAVSQVNLKNGDTLDPAGLLMLLSPQQDLRADELEAILAFAKAGGSLFITCDVTDPVGDMPNYQSLLRLYGFIPREGMVVAGADEAGTYYNNYQIALLPYMQSTPATGALVSGGADTLLLALCRAFEEPEQTDNSLTVEPVLYSGYKAYLHPLDTESLSIEQSVDDPLGPFPLALLASRMMDSGTLGRAFIIGNSTFLTDSQSYAITDSGPFILKMATHLLGQEAVSLDIAAKAAVRPGLSAAGQGLGIALIVAVPLLVMLAAVWVLLPRRHR